MKYKIKKGKHSGFTMRRFWLFRWSKLKRKFLEFEIVIENLYDTQQDNDLRHDWSKLIGINLTAFKPSNVNSIMSGFKSNDKKYETTLYRNSNGTQIYDNDQISETSAGSPIKGFIKYIGDDNYHVAIGNNAWIFRELNRSYFCRIIFPWFGGKDDDNNGLGGVAPEDICFTIKYKWIKK